MSTIQKFRNYALWIIGFFIISVILENALVADMYRPMSGTANGEAAFVGPINSDLEVTVEEAKATNMNGYLLINVKNTTGKYIEKCCAKIDLFTSRGILAATEYVDISRFDINETRQFKIKFKGQEITKYEVSLIKDAPDKTHILNLFGWEIDLRNVLGMDLTSVFNLENIKQTGLNLWGLTINFLNTIPAWAYLIAGGIVVWYMPKGFLFGVFPF